MKSKKSIIATLWVAIAIIAWSCNDDESPINEPQKENVVADNFLVNSNSALSKLRVNGIGAPVGAMFGNFQANSSGRTTSTPSTMFKNGATHKSSDDQPTCLVETWEDDGNGTYTYTMDFGDGCEYYGEWLKGKLVEQGSYNDNSFSATTTFTNFGGHSWTIDGTHSYSGTWEDIEDDDSDPNDSTNFKFNASYEFSADLVSSYVEFDSTDLEENLIEIHYVSNGSEDWNQDGYTIKSRTESVEMNNGDSYNSQVDIPLYYDFSCEDEDVWIFVSGKESGTYTYGNQNGTYSINYGNGTCDNIILLTENGVTEEIDLGELWDNWDNECGSEN